jgi:hypothetical protein
MIVLLVAARGFSRSSSSSLLSMFLLAFRAYAHSSEPACGVLARGRIEKGQERFEEEQRRFRAAEEVFLRTDDEHIVCCYIMVD